MSAGNSLQRIIDFVNTREVDGEVEHIPDPPSVRAWLAEHGLPAGAVPLTATDVRRVHKIREALRTVLQAHHDGAMSPELPAATEVLASVPLRLRVADDGTIALDALGDGVDAALGRLLAPIPAAAADGTWERTKICPSDTCEWAFYDQSRNRSRRWCSMEVCGNREKSKTFRAARAAD